MTIVEKLVLAFLLVVYATGCAATAVELHTQTAEALSPAQRALAKRYPKVHVLTLATMVALWPFLMTWTKVRDYWR